MQNRIYVRLCVFFYVFVPFRPELCERVEDGRLLIENCPIIVLSVSVRFYCDAFEPFY